MSIGMLLVNGNKLGPEAQADNGHIDWFFAHAFYFSIFLLFDFAFYFAVCPFRPRYTGRRVFTVNVLCSPLLQKFVSIACERILAFREVSPDAHRRRQLLICRCEALDRHHPLIADSLQCPPVGIPTGIACTWCTPIVFGYLYMDQLVARFD